MIKLFIDDVRDAPDDSWTVVRKVQPAIDFIGRYMLQIKEYSFDHDIENRPDDETFRPIAHMVGMTWSWGQEIARKEVGKEMEPPKITIHSINPSGAREIQNILMDYGLTSTLAPYKADLERMEREFGVPQPELDKTQAEPID